MNKQMAILLNQTHYFYVDVYRGRFIDYEYDNQHVIEIHTQKQCKAITSFLFLDCDKWHVISRLPDCKIYVKWEPINTGCNVTHVSKLIIDVSELVLNIIKYGIIHYYSDVLSELPVGEDILSEIISEIITTDINEWCNDKLNM
jgi:hypothetical protein